jgi:3'(2'), 5'-bisphosphate nucleotidase
MQDIVENLIAIADEAASVALGIYNTTFEVDYKGPNDPVTEADRLANELICERLTKQYPHVAIVAEESAPETFANFRSSEAVFFVDPVDGTREFVERNGEFAVMIGLLEGDRVTAGIIHAPALGKVWVGHVAHGAWLIENDKTRTPIHVSATASLAEGSVVSSRSHRSARLEQALQHLGAKKVQFLGSAGLKGTEVARGAAEAYVAPQYAGKRWDACATEAIVVAAGGRFTDAYGDPISYRGPSLVNDKGMVASNGKVHDEILRKLSELA